MGDITKFKQECCTHIYKLATGRVHSVSIFHKPTSLRVERRLGPGERAPICQEELFNKLREMVQDYELRKKYGSSRAASSSILEK